MSPLDPPDRHRALSLASPGSRIFAGLGPASFGALRRAVATIGAAALACGCHGKASSREEPSPSASVITLGVALGGCDDVPLCEKECDGGSADRCRRLGATYALGQGVAKDEARATGFYERACAMKDPAACVFAGQMHEYARGVPKDDRRAAGFYERACDLQWAPGCYNLAIMYEHGRGVAEDRVKAGDLYQVACTAGAQMACDRAAAMHQPAPPPFLDAGSLR